MKKHRRNMILVTITAAFLLAGCATAVAPVITEPSPITVVAEPGEYDVKIYEMDPNAVVDIPEEPVPQAPTVVMDVSPANPLTKRQAEALAIQIAGLTQDDVKFLFSKEDREDGIPVIEVDFRSGNYAYEFEFIRDTGEVLTYEKEDVRND